MDNPYKLRDLVNVTALVAILAGLLSFVGPAIDDYTAAADQAKAASEAEAQAARELRRDLAAAKLCRLSHGEAGFTWTASGQLVCIPRHGNRIVETDFNTNTGVFK